MLQPSYSKFRNIINSYSRLKKNIRLCKLSFAADFSEKSIVPVYCSCGRTNASRTLVWAPYVQSGCCTMHKLTWFVQISKTVTTDKKLLFLAQCRAVLVSAAFVPGQERTPCRCTSASARSFSFWFDHGEGQKWTCTLWQSQTPPITWCWTVRQPGTAQMLSTWTGTDRVHLLVSTPIDHSLLVG